MATVELMQNLQLNEEYTDLIVEFEHNWFRIDVDTEMTLRYLKYLIYLRTDVPGYRQYFSNLIFPGKFTSLTFS